MAMCVCERDREKVGDQRGESGSECRGGRESIGWEIEEV